MLMKYSYIVLNPFEFQFRSFTQITILNSRKILSIGKIDANQFINSLMKNSDTSRLAISILIRKIETSSKPEEEF